MLMDRVRSRRDKLLETAISLEARGESFLAKKYASEISKLDKAYSRLADIKLVLEKVAMSLEYAINVRKAQEVYGEVYALLQELKKVPETSFREVGSVVLELEYAIRSLQDHLSESAFSLDFDVASDNNVNRILEEARSILKTKLEAELSSESSESSQSS